MITFTSGNLHQVACKCDVLNYCKTFDFDQSYTVLNAKIPEFFSENPNFDINPGQKVKGGGIAGIQVKF